jgi:glycerophosphoryl diester phosphodiesterase
MRYLLIIIAVIILASCVPALEPITIPDYSSNLSGTDSLSTDKLNLIEGVYLIKRGKSEFGEKAVIKQIKNGLSIFFQSNISYSITKVGKKDNDIKIEGFWRFAVNSNIGKISLKINQDSGAKQILNGIKSDSIYISGTFDMDGTNRKIELQYYKPLANTDKYIIAHRGGGRNQDRLPCSENSSEMIKYCEILGTNSIEIDVRLTSDSVPVLFHDEYLNKRLVLEDYLLGKVSDYTYKQLKSFATLKNGEKIPSLEEALEAVVNNSNLKLVWLDVKSPAALKILAPIQKKYLELAKKKGRTLEIVLGLADAELLDGYKQVKDYCNYTSLLELDFNKIDIDCYSYWAPRWTLGLNDAILDELHKRNKKAFVWTLDVPDFISTFIKKGKFDGILSNYPSQVAYEYYSQDN